MELLLEEIKGTVRGLLYNGIEDNAVRGKKGIRKERGIERVVFLWRIEMHRGQ